MKRKPGVFLLMFLVPLWLCAAFPEDYWKQNGTLELSKDEFYRFSVSMDEKPKELFFRWTLYKNEGLIMHLHYDGFVHQFILYRDYQIDSFKLKLASRPEAVPQEEPYFMLVFKNFSRRTEMATLDYYFYEGNSEFDIQMAE